MFLMIVYMTSQPWLSARSTLKETGTMLYTTKSVQSGKGEICQVSHIKRVAPNYAKLSGFSCHNKRLSHF